VEVQIPPRIAQPPQGQGPSSLSDEPPPAGAAQVSKIPIFVRTKQQLTDLKQTRKTGSIRNYFLPKNTPTTHAPTASTGLQATVDPNQVAQGRATAPAKRKKDLSDFERYKASVVTKARLKKKQLQVRVPSLLLNGLNY